jgi:hypothetical protein
VVYTDDPRGLAVRRVPPDDFAVAAGAGAGAAVPALAACYGVVLGPGPFETPGGRRVRPAGWGGARGAGFVGEVEYFLAPP